MSGQQQFVVTDIDVQELEQAIHEKGHEVQPTLIKEEDFNREDMLLFSSADVQYQQNGRGFEMVEAFGNTVSIPENSNYSIPFSEEHMNQLLMASASEDPYSKLPIDLSQLFKFNGVKTEQVMANQHLVKYKPDENGKHIKVWECAICHKEFGHQYILMRHLPTHTDERKFQCKQCGKAFRQMSTLSQHRAIHSKLRPYVCEVCQKTFNRVSTLISHRKTHTGLKPHRCHLCNKAFHQKGNLRNHIFTHTNERPYKCDVCQKGFNQMSNLMCHKFKAHQRADKPKYNCQACGKEFEKRIGLRNHEQYEHGDLATASTAVNSPSVKYTNGVLVSPINTAAMRHAIATNQVPFALLRPSNGIPVLVRVLPAGDKQMLVPATAEDLKKFGEISIKSKDEDEEEKKNVATNKNNPENEAVAASSNIADNSAVNPGFSADDKKGGATVQIRIPVVASVVQRCRDGTMHMDIESPGPKRDGQDEGFIFTTTDEEFNRQTDSWQSEVKAEDTLPEATISEIPPILDCVDEDPSIRFYNIEEAAADDKNEIIISDYPLRNPEEIPMFGEQDMVLDLNSTPTTNGTQNQDNVMISEVFVDTENNQVFEKPQLPPHKTPQNREAVHTKKFGIVDTEAAESKVSAYKNHQEDCEIQVD